MAFIPPLVAAAAGAAGTAGTIASVAGTAFSVLGTIRQGQAAKAQAQGQANISNFNAQVARNNALAATQAADIEASNIRDDTRRRISTIRASQAGGGADVGAGSSLLAQVEQREEGELEAQRRLFSGQLQSQGQSIQAQLDEAQAAAFKKQGQSAFNQSLLTAGGQVIGSSTGQSILSGKSILK